MQKVNLCEGPPARLFTQLRKDYPKAKSTQVNSASGTILYTVEERMQDGFTPYPLATIVGEMRDEDIAQMVADILNQEKGMPKSKDETTYTVKTMEETEQMFLGEVTTTNPGERNMVRYALFHNNKMAYHFPTQLAAAIGIIRWSIQHAVSIPPFQILVNRVVEKTETNVSLSIDAQRIS